MIDPDHHRAFLERRWPDLAVETFAPLPGGWDFFTRPSLHGVPAYRGEPMSADVDGIWPERLGRSCTTCI